MTVHLWAIGGVYEHRTGSHRRIESFLLNEGGVSVSDVTRHSQTAQRNFYVDKKDLSGPTHLPCPYCGELQIVNSESGLAAMRGEGQIDFPEHMMRCRP